MTQFSILLPTRNRPDSFRVALRSVLMQHDADFDIVAVQDGGDAAHEPAYQQAFAEAEQALGKRFQLHRLAHRARGHGHPFALNTAASLALGTYLGFLDDDDCWTDDRHLNRAAAAINAQAQPVDLYLANQEAWRDGTLVLPHIWLADLTSAAPALLLPDALGCIAVTLPDLLAASGFCHLNTTLIRRTLFDAIGGADEALRYEFDRDLYFRAIDQAGLMLHQTGFVARHNVPDAISATSASTAVRTREKRLWQIFILERLAGAARAPELRRHAATQARYTLARMAEEAEAAGDVVSAFRHARQALALRPAPGLLRRTLRLAGSALR